MEEKFIFLHVGLTVSNIDRIIDFYSKYFGLALERKSVFPLNLSGLCPGSIARKGAPAPIFLF